MSKVDFNEVVQKAANMPLVKVDRNDFLKSQFEKKMSENELKKVLDLGPVAAGIKEEDLIKVANSSIRLEITK